MLGIGIGLNKSKANTVSLGLLDQYPGVAAYSLRYLTNNYTGDVVLVRRSSDNAEEGFTPSEIVDGTLLSFCGAGNGFVKTWYDQSGNSLDATQNTAGNQPTIVASGVLKTLNGKPCVSSNDKFLSIPLSLYSTDTQYLNVFSIYALNIVGDYPIILGNNGTSKGFISLHFDNDRLVRLATIRNGGNSVYNGTTILTVNDPVLRTDIVDRFVAQTYLNGSVEINQTDNNSDFDFTGVTEHRIFQTGSAGQITGIDLNELIIYSSDQSANRAAIESAINNYYSIY